MWGPFKKALLSLSVIVLFALYAVQQRTQPTSQPAAIALVVPTRTTVPAAPSASAPPTPRPTSSSGLGASSAAASSRAPFTSSSLPTQTPSSAPTRSPYPSPSTSVPTTTASSRAVTSAHPSPSSSSSSSQTNAAASGGFQDGTYTGSSADAQWGTVQVQAVITNGQVSDVQFLQYPNHRSRSQTINQQAMPILTQEAIQSQQADVDVVTGATDTSDAFIQSLAAALTQAKA